MVESAPSTNELPPMREDWQRALAVVAHPDDMEYGAAAAVARWTSAGKEVAYVLVTRGEAGISSLPPGQCGPLREEEQHRSCAVVGVTDLSFLDHRDGLVEADLKLRADLTGAIRHHRPEVILSINHRDTWGCRAGTTLTTVMWEWPCSMRCATPPTRGCSATGDLHGRALGSSPSAVRRRPPIGWTPPPPTPPAWRRWPSIASTSITSTTLPAQPSSG